ncbi:MAG: alanyl-tRNA editing protein AlaXM [Candidatus Micrarchaeota archaeon]|nr:alanyl-tRNA editing protein AlaXM [Candidatus Micrarchaeota archaeon]
MAGQEFLYLDDSYLKECESIARCVRNGRLVILDKTIFYPGGGGQPCDLGTLVRVSDGAVFAVKSVRKENGEAVHEVDADGLKEGDAVKCIIDWERRYALMRMHTAAHILASIFYREGGAQITGNQIDVGKSRFDFSMEGFDREKMEEYVRKANEIFRQGIDVKVYSLPREEAMKIDGIVKLANALPPSIPTLRIVEVPGVDIQADGGTHVKNTREIGTIEIIKLENKGKENKRIYFTLR